MGWKIDIEGEIEKVKAEAKLMSDAIQDIIDRISAMEESATVKKSVDLHAKPKKKAKKDVDSSKDKKQD
tara:strand:- start:7 stop:213 length:207 start_codon:yes stop_codon:yes gene_type:complete